MTTTATLTLNKIGNFVGLRIRELLDLISSKADRAEVDALPRFREANTSSEMLHLDGVRVGDFCLRLDTKSGYRLRAFPASDSVNWLQVFAASNASIQKSVAFAAGLTPTITHDMNRIPSMITVTDETGRVNIVDWRPLDMDHIQLYFTEAIGGVCSMTFSA